MKGKIIRALRIAAPALIFGILFLFAADTHAQVDAQSRLMAKRAAKADALRNLTETIYGVRIDSSTNVRDFVTQSDSIRTRMEVVIQGARELDYKELPDGTAEVTVEITLGQVEDILGRKIYYNSNTFAATGYGAPSGGASSVSTPPVSASPEVIRAKGNGIEPNDSSMTRAERALMAKRAAKLDALRNLAEQVHGVKIKSDSYVRDFVTQSDEIRAKVHTFVQGARVLYEKKMPDGSYEAEVEIDLEPLRKIFR